MLANLLRPFKPQGIHSLRDRYLSVTTILGIVLILVTWLAQYHVGQTSRESTQLLDLRNQLSAYSNEMRQQMERIERDLHFHMFNPSTRLYKQWQVAVDHMLASSNEILKLDHGDKLALKNSISQLREQLVQLRKEGTYMMQIRMHSVSQYPAVSIITKQMHPNNLLFVTQLSLIQSEWEQETSHSPERREVRLLVEQAYRNWVQMVSLFRLYLANNMGNLFEVDFNSQENDLEQRYQQIGSLLKKLKNFDEQGLLGIAATDSIKLMEQARQAWYEGYLEIRKISHFGSWRNDVKVMEQKLVPLLLNVSRHLADLEKRVEKYNTESMTSLTQLVNLIIQSIWVMAFLGMVIVVVGYFYIIRFVIRPMAGVSRAMNAQAKGETIDMLPAGDTQESAELISAFNIMQRRVNSREMALRYQAMHDSLTGLPNRALLLDRIENMIEQGKRENTPFALMLMDLDRFKEINDTLGHQAGDELLIKVGQRIQKLIRSSDTVARLGGDEFCLLLPKMDRQATATIVQKLSASLEQPFNIAERRIYIGCSIGISLFPEHGDNNDELMRFADVAMYMAKRQGVLSAVYDPKEDINSLSRLELVNQLREAISHNELTLFFQPKVNLKQNRITGVEALIRWQHPELGLLHPGQFIHLAEQSALINQLTRWVIDESIRYHQLFRTRGYLLNIAVNLSAENLKDHEITDLVKSAVHSKGIEPDYLTLEVTESAMMNEPEFSERILKEVAETGVKVAIDDFGTGFSSLSYLQRLPVDELKIDKSFVMDMYRNEGDLAIVRSTIDLAHNLELKVIAEGVENVKSLDCLKEMGCDYVQGFYIAKPMSEAQLLKWLQKTAFDTAGNS